MKIKNFRFRLPWTYDVAIDIDEALYWSFRKTVAEDIAYDILEYAKSTHPKHAFTVHCERCDIVAAYRHAAKIARTIDEV